MTDAAGGRDKMKTRGQGPWFYIWQGNKKGGLSYERQLIICHSSVSCSSGEPFFPSGPCGPCGPWGGENRDSGPDPQVIMDTDMTYLGDDAFCMYILSQADEAGWIDFLGVTTVGGNSICATGTNAVLRQLEEVDRTDIPVYIGTDIPILG